MSISESLNYRESYEWVGTFWFPSEPQKKFSGKITYSFENGIRLSLMGSLESRNDALKSYLMKKNYLAKKVLHAVVKNNSGTTPMTIFNVGLSVGFTLGGISTSSLNGRARLLVMGELLTDFNFDRYQVRYNKQFNNIFFWDHENNPIDFAKNPPIAINGGLEISIAASSKNKLVVSPDEFENLFWSYDAEEFQKFMQQVRPLLKKDFLLFARHSVEPSVCFVKKGISITDFIELERRWRRFWRLISDGEIWVESSALGIPMMGSEFQGEYKFAQILAGFYQPKDQRESDRIIQELPINFTHFKGKPYDLSNVSACISIWLDLNKDEKWRSVFYGVERILKARSQSIDSSKFVSLVADIETFLDLIGHPKGNLDELIEIHASQNWRKGFKKLSGPISETAGKWAKEIRNAITHPKAASRKANGKYWKIATDVPLLNKVYCYLSALLIKGVLSHLNTFEEVDLERYTQDFIHRRASFEPIVYED